WFAWEGSRIWRRCRRDRFPGWLSRLGTGRRRRAAQQDPAQDLRRNPEFSQEQHQQAPYHGREYNRPPAPARPSKDRRCRQEAWDERANTDTQALRRGRDIQRDPAAAQGQLGDPLFGRRRHADLADRLASRFRGGELLQSCLPTVDWQVTPAAASFSDSNL